MALLIMSTKPFTVYMQHSKFPSLFAVNCILKNSNYKFYLRELSTLSRVELFTIIHKLKHVQIS